MGLVHVGHPRPRQTAEVSELEQEPRPVSPTEVEEAAQRLAGRLRHTPVVMVEAGAFTGEPVLVKLESLQHTGSFKPRGMLNAMLMATIPPVGVVVASGGNAGLAVAWAARELGHRSTVFVPTTSPAAKVDRLRGLGATVNQVGERYDDALAASTAFAAETGAAVIHAYDQRAVVAGQGTLFRELEQQAMAIAHRDASDPDRHHATDPGLDTVLVAVGGGGLVAGAAAWFAGRVKVVAVEPAASCCLHAALAAGRRVDVEVGGIASDALGARRVGELCWAGREHIGASVIVDDAAIVAARRALWEHLRVVAEPGGATALAALTSGLYRPEAGERVAVVVCGANTDPATL
jgi:threonine dehydratase